MAQKHQKKEQVRATRQSISAIDLTMLPTRELVNLRRKIDDILLCVQPEIGALDVVMDYDIVLRSADGVVGRNQGSVRMNHLLSQRLLGAAPSRLETEFKNNVFEPVNAMAYDLFDNNNPTARSLGLIRTAHPAGELPAPGDDGQL